MAKEKKSFDMDLIRQLADVLNETGLNEIEIGQEDFSVRVARGASGTVSYSAPPATAPAPAATASGTEGADSDNLDNHPGAVTSPMVGTVYLSPAPNAAPFVTVGAQVSEGDPLLIIEAMKTMNQIPAPRAGKVTRILVGNEEPVEFGEVLVIIE